MSDLYFIELRIHLLRPLKMIVRGKLKHEILRRFYTSIPISDRDRAEQLMNHWAKGLAETFAETVKEDERQRKSPLAIRTAPNQGEGQGDGVDGASTVPVDGAEGTDTGDSESPSGPRFVQPDEEHPGVE